MKTVAKWLLPPIMLDLVRWIISRFSLPEWEYVPEGWARQTTDLNVKGWNVVSVLDAYKLKWPSFVDSLRGNGPLGISHEAKAISNEDFFAHNTMVSYAYVCALVAHQKPALSMLDWGGGIGHYYLLSRAILPNVRIEYHCKDVPALCAYGSDLFPEAKFYIDETCFENSYDFVLASGSLQYSEHWQATLRQLAHSTKNYLYVTRLPVVESRSFVVLQRAYKYGYGTEYLGWFINRFEVIDCAMDAGMELVREFIIAEKPIVRNAPAQAEYRGFLFRPSRSVTIE